MGNLISQASTGVRGQYDCNIEQVQASMVRSSSKFFFQTEKIKTNMQILFLMVTQLMCNDKIQE